MVLASIDVPTLARHRVGDAIVSIDWARQTIAAIPGARLVEYPGADHFVQTGDDVDAWLDLVEEFSTGTPPRPRVARRARRFASVRSDTTIRTLGGFAVTVGETTFERLSQDWAWSASGTKVPTRTIMDSISVSVMIESISPMS